MDKKRLLKVAQRMEDVHVVLEEGKAPIEFDLHEWGQLKEEDKFENREDLSCLTAACAIGHCGNLFTEEGFTLIARGRNLVPTFLNMNNWDAVKAFFGISQLEAEYLFASSRYRFEREDEVGGFSYNDIYHPMPAEVADRIRRFVRSGKIGKY